MYSLWGGGGGESVVEKICKSGTAFRPRTDVIELREGELCLLRDDVSVHTLHMFMGCVPGVRTEDSDTNTRFQGTIMALARFDALLQLLFHI